MNVAACMAVGGARKKNNSNSNNNKKSISYHNRTHLLLFFYLCVISVMLYDRRVDRRSALADHISVSLFCPFAHQFTIIVCVSAHIDFSMLIILFIYIYLLMLMVAGVRCKFIRQHLAAIKHDV